jgi:hypothetical protein
MKPRYQSRGTGRAQLYTIRWILVTGSRQSQAEGGKAALAELCRLYGYPLCSFTRRRITQVERLKGESRSFLRESFQNYFSNESQGARRFKREWRYECLFLDWERAETTRRPEPADHLTVEKIFDAGWSTTLLDEAMTLFRHALIATKGCSGP